jgi:MFS family permease
MAGDERAGTGSAARRWRRPMPLALPPVLRQRTFRRYWSAVTVSVLGDGVSSVALPLTAVLYLHADAAQMGYLTALFWAPSLLFSVPAGILADRVGQPRAMMVAADLGRAVLLGGIPASAALHVLSLPELCAMVFAEGVLSTLFDVCGIAMFAASVPEGQYVEGQSVLYGSQSAASLGGPPLGGAVTAVLSAPLAVAADAVSFLCSAAFLSGIPAATRGTRAERRAVSYTAGLRFIGRTPVIRTALTVTATVNFFNMMFNALLVLYMSQYLHFQSGYIGLVFSAGALGGLAGAVLATRLARAVGLGFTLLAGSVLISAPLLLVPITDGTLTAALALLLLTLACSGVGRSMQNISVGTVFAATVPGTMISEVKGAYRMISMGARPLGALLGGALGSLAGVRQALLIAAIGGTLSCLWMIGSPLLTFRVPRAEHEPASARAS